MSNSIKPKTSSEIIAAVAEASNESKKIVKDIIDTYHNILLDELMETQEVKVGNLGKMKIKFRAAREGVNPSTGEKVSISGKAVPKFLFAKGVKDEVDEKFTK